MRTAHSTSQMSGERGNLLVQCLLVSAIFSRYKAFTYYAVKYSLSVKCIKTTTPIYLWLEVKWAWLLNTHYKGTSILTLLHVKLLPINHSYGTCCTSLKCEQTFNLILFLLYHHFLRLSAMSGRGRERVGNEEGPRLRKFRQEDYQDESDEERKKQTYNGNSTQQQ